MFCYCMDAMQHYATQCNIIQLCSDLILFKMKNERQFYIVHDTTPACPQHLPPPPPPTTTTTTTNRWARQQTMVSTGSRHLRTIE